MLRKPLRVPLPEIKRLLNFGGDKREVSKMLVTLYGKAFKALLIDMSLTLGVIVSMVSHRMRTSDPFHKSTQFTTNH